MKRWAWSVLFLATFLPARAFAEEAHLDLEVTADPRTVPAGEGSVLTVLASHEGRPVADVEVLLESETGVFGLAARAASGRTDADGRFRTVWRADPSTGPAPTRFHAIDYQATKPGFPSVTGRLLLQAEPAPAAPPPSRPVLFVVARAEPPAVEAGMPTRVLVVVREGSARGAPVAGVQVEARARFGTFEETLSTAAAGTTDANGRAQMTWIAASEADARTGAVASVGIRATREGYGAGNAVLEIGVLPVAGRATPTRPDPRPPAGPLALQVRADPSRVPAGGRTKVTARVSLANGEPLAEADVTVAAGGGSFEGGTGGSVAGRTGTDGTFVAVWRPLAPEAYTGDMAYALSVQVVHPRYGSAQGEVTVEVVAPQAPGGPTIPARGLVVEAVADPPVIAAGGRATVLVQVRTRDRAPVAGARVEVATGSGSFDGHRGAIAAGLTDGAGRFLAVWRTADPSAYRSDLDVLLGVTASAPGHGEATIQVPVRVTTGSAGPTPIPVTPIPIPGPQQPMSLSVAPERSSVPAGSTAWILVRVAQPGGAPVAGASIELRSSGGTFVTTSAPVVRGTTDAQGRLRVEWRTDGPDTYRTPRAHEFTATATRAGFSSGTNRGSVTVTPLDIR